MLMTAFQVPGPLRQAAQPDPDSGEEEGREMRESGESFPHLILL